MSREEQVMKCHLMCQSSHVYISFEDLNEKSLGGFPHVCLSALFYKCVNFLYIMKDPAIK